jgi:hypothetical protein
VCVYSVQRQYRSRIVTYISLRDIHLNILLWVSCQRREMSTTPVLLRRGASSASNLQLSAAIQEFVNACSNFKVVTLARYKACHALVYAISDSLLQHYPDTEGRFPAGGQSVQSFNLGVHQLLLRPVVGEAEVPATLDLTDVNGMEEVLDREATWAGGRSTLRELLAAKDAGLSVRSLWRYALRHAVCAVL